MVSRPLRRKVGRDLWRRKAAVLSIVAIVAVGVGTFTAMRSVYRDLDQARQVSPTRAALQETDLQSRGGRRTHRTKTVDEAR